jgi:DNA-binding NarL/FixJ family response regulator
MPLPQQHANSALLGALTKREQQVVMLICEGHANKTIAQKLNLREGTVKLHVSNIYRTLGLRGRHDLIKVMFP